MNDDTNQFWQNHWDAFAEAFAHPLTANGLLSKFVANPDVTGAYAETYVRQMARSMLPQFRVSTGAIVRPTDQRRGLKSIPQCDIVIWDPSELPALFEQGDFALVPYVSARAIIEVKRTCRNLEAFRTQLKAQQKCLSPNFRSNILGVVVSHRKTLFTGVAQADWLKSAEWENFPAMTRLLSADAKEVDTSGVFVFVYFLAQIAGRNRLAV